MKSTTLIKELDAQLAKATREVQSWPEWMLVKSGFDRVLQGEPVEVK